MFITLFFFLHLNVCAQVIAIKDSVDLKPIKYAEINLNGNIYFSDSLGKINFNIETFPEDSIRIRGIGYHQKKILKKNLKDVILLTPRYENIEEVKILPLKDYFIGGKSSKGNSSTIPKGVELGYIINNPYNKEGFITGITIPLKEIYDDTVFIVLNFYELGIDNIPSNNMTKNNAIVIPLKKQSLKKELKFKLSGIKMPINGFLVSVQLLSKVGEISNKIEYPMAKFYNNKQNKNSVYFFNKIEGWKKFNAETPSINFGFDVKM